MANAPSTQPNLQRTLANGIEVACFEWRADLQGTAPTLLMVHATGFHGRVWDQVIARLPDHQVLALELRGHGRSEPRDFNSWEDFGRDVAAFSAARGLQGAIGIGHSMGAHALVQAAAFEPGRFSRLVLIDPTIMAPAFYHAPPADVNAAHPAALRKNRFDSPQAMFDRFADRVPYSVFDRQALRDYCEHGLVPLADQTDTGGGSGRVAGHRFELACAPAFEAQVYIRSRGNLGVHASVRALQIPVLVVRARPMQAGILPFDPLGSPTWPQLAAEFHNGRDVQLTSHTHMLPMQDPALVAKLIDDFMAEPPR